TAVAPMVGMQLIRRALGLGLVLVAVHAARPACAAAQTAQQQWQLVLANYTLSALAQFTGKVIRGENVGRAARRAPLEALGPAAPPGSPTRSWKRPGGASAANKCT